MKLRSLALVSTVLSSSCRAKAGGTVRGRSLQKAESILGESSAICTSNCLPHMPNRDFTKLNKCLKTKFPSGREQTVTYLRYADGSGKNVTKITDPRDGQRYADARYLDSEKVPGYESLPSFPAEVRWPAFIVYAESEEEVRDAVVCATGAGYKIAPRGRGHSYRGLSTLDGYVVIDVSPMCHPDEFVLEREVADWILPGQKRIGSVKNGPGCTNAAMLGYTYENFAPEEGGLYAIGACPSVGIVGYSTGGGAGDATPWIGWGVDDVLEVDMILHDGTKVTANENENTDLFWAIQGGGSGLGVITAMKTAVVQSPEPQEGMQRRFCYFTLYYKTENDEVRKAFLNAMQEFLYESVADSSRFGGGGGLGEDASHLGGVFLGSIGELLEVFGNAGLLDPDLLDRTPTSYFSDYIEVSPDQFPLTMPSTGLEAREFKSFGEAMLTKICTGFVSTPDTSIVMVSLSKGFSWCVDLNISRDKCFKEELFPGTGIAIEVPKCDDPEVISAFADAASDPVSFLNRQGPSAISKGSLGGLLIPKVDVDVLNEIAKIGIPINHLQHGAPTMKASTDTAWPWRDTAILTEFLGPGDAERMANVTSILVNRHYMDATKLQGYYNYMNPLGNPNWRKYYFGDNYGRLSHIKAKYDPLNFFGNPMQVEPESPGVHFDSITLDLAATIS